jgi:acyl carrier protein
MQGRLEDVGVRRETVTDLEALVQRAISTVCDIDPARVQPDAKLGDLGVDSLAAAEVLVELEITLGRDLPVDVLRRLDRVDTVRGIASELEAAFGGEVPRPRP